MPKFVQNTKTGTIVDVQGAQMISIMKGQVHNGHKGFSVVCFHNPGSGYKVAEFSYEPDAIECLDKVVGFMLEGKGILAVADIVTDSLIQMPESSAKSDKNFIR